MELERPSSSQGGAGLSGRAPLLPFIPFLYHVIQQHIHMVNHIIAARPSTSGEERVELCSAWGDLGLTRLTAISRIST
jgi:hypothetical protein